MLINIRISELTSDSSNSIPLAIIIGIFFNITLYKLLPSNVFTPSIFFIQNKLESIGVPIEGNITHSNTVYPLNKSMDLFSSNDLFFVTSQI